MSWCVPTCQSYLSSPIMSGLWVVLEHFATIKSFDMIKIPQTVQLEKPEVSLLISRNCYSNWLTGDSDNSFTHTVLLYRLTRRKLEHSWCSFTSEIWPQSYVITFQQPIHRFFNQRHIARVIGTGTVKETRREKGCTADLNTRNS